jgi:hypothetical protein
MSVICVNLCNLWTIVNYSLLIGKECLYEKALFCGGMRGAGGGGTGGAGGGRLVERWGLQQAFFE